MKKLRVAAILLLLCVMTVLSAQERELMPVDWTKVRHEVENRPDYVKGLVQRLAADTLDKSLSPADRILAFYGQSFLTNDKEEPMRSTLYQQQNEGLLEECVATAKEMLAINPLNLDALITAGEVLYNMAEDSTGRYRVTVDEARPYLNRAMRLMNTIALTGDGSADHPFYVTKVSDEYCFMRYYLDLWKYDSQYATSCCDVFELNEVSEYYIRPTISFEITRVYELERERLGM